MDMYGGYHYGGMHLIWWFVWVILLFWVFVIPYNIPGQRSRKETPLEILNRQLASGKINRDEYLEKKKLMQ
ncbi:MAG: putative membrane protein [Marinoscillum sp.]|jgi:putative membrane protein